LNIKEIKKTNKFNKKQINYLEKNKLIIVKEKDYNKFKSINYKRPIQIISEKICSFIYSEMEEKLKVYKKEEVENLLEKTKKEIIYYIESFMDMVYVYDPQIKKSKLSRKEDRRKILERVKKYKIWEVFYEYHGKKIISESDLVLNKLKARKIIKDLSEKNKKNYKIMERKII